MGFAPTVHPPLTDRAPFDAAGKWGNMELFRPVGMVEYQQIAAAHFTGFPPRAAHQPIFHLVLQQRFGEEIAQYWNAMESLGSKRYLLRFCVDDAYISGFPIQPIGGDDKQELWIPADEIKILNQHIIGDISVVREFCNAKLAMPEHEKCVFFV